MIAAARSTGPGDSGAGQALRCRALQLADAIERSSFGRLRAQEEKEGFRERPKAAERFFREGRAGQWKEVLTAQQVARVASDHGEQMARFGYGTDL
jgi:hypothetical protein